MGAVAPDEAAPQAQPTRRPKGRVLSEDAPVIVVVEPGELPVTAGS